MKAVFFDIDDTLIPFKLVNARIIKTLSERILSECPNVNSALLSTSVSTLLKKVMPKINCGRIKTSKFPRLLYKALTPIGVKQEIIPSLFPDYLRLLESIRAYPDCRVIPYIKRADTMLGVITNGPSDIQLRKLDSIGMTNLFDVVICSSDLGICKPDGRIFKIAAAKAGIDPNECYMVGNDLEVDVSGAERVGLIGIWLDRDKSNVKTRRWDGKTIKSLTQLSRFIF